MVGYQVFADSKELSRAAADMILKRACRAVEERGRFSIALSGGSTPKLLFQILAGGPYRLEMPWDRTLVFWGDDRAVPSDHEFSNYRLAREALLERVSVPADNVMRIQGELGAARAAGRLRDQLVGVFGERGLPRLDFAILGLGLDGHTASLFPGAEVLNSTDWVEPIFAPPATPRLDRVTLTLPGLNNTGTVLFLVTGVAKRAIIREIVEDPTASERYPAARVKARETHWFLDKEALGDIDE